MDVIQQAMLAWLRLPVAAQGFIFVAIFVLYWLLNEAFQLLLDHCGHIKAIAKLREWWIFGDMPALEPAEPAAAAARSPAVQSSGARSVASSPPPPPKPEPLPTGFLDFDEDLGVVDTVENLQRLRQAAAHAGTQQAEAAAPTSATESEASTSAIAGSAASSTGTLSAAADAPTVDLHTGIVRRRAVGERAEADAAGQSEAKALAQVPISRHADGSLASLGRVAVPPTPMAGAASQAVRVA